MSVGYQHSKDVTILSHQHHVLFRQVLFQMFEKTLLKVGHRILQARIILKSFTLDLLKD